MFFEKLIGVGEAIDSAIVGDGHHEVSVEDTGGAVDAPDDCRRLVIISKTSNEGLGDVALGMREIRDYR